MEMCTWAVCKVSNYKEEKISLHYVEKDNSRVYECVMYEFMAWHFTQQNTQRNFLDNFVVWLEEECLEMFSFFKIIWNIRAISVTLIEFALNNKDNKEMIVSTCSNSWAPIQNKIHWVFEINQDNFNQNPSE